MDWVLNHLQLIIAVAAVIAYWINQQKAAARGEKEDDASSARPFESAPPNAEDAERTRQIQAEIRRKIAERSGGTPLPPARPMTSERPLAPPILAPRPVAKEMSPSLRDRLEAKLAEARARTEAAIKERQHRLEEQARTQEEEQLAAEHRAAEIAAQARKAAHAPATNTRTTREVKSWSDELRDPASMRRAIILREVLGPPVGLR